MGLVPEPKTSKHCRTPSPWNGESRHWDGRHCGSGRARRASCRPSPTGPSSPRPPTAPLSVLPGTAASSCRWAGSHPAGPTRGSPVTPQPGMSGATLSTPGSVWTSSSRSTGVRPPLGLPVIAPLLRRSPGFGSRRGRSRSQTSASGIADHRPEKITRLVNRQHSVAANWVRAGWRVLARIPRKEEYAMVRRISQGLVVRFVP